MTRHQKITRARALRAEGMLMREIAAEMGVATSTVKGWISDPDRSKQKARRAKYSQPCVDCGRPTDGSGGFAQPRQRCNTCSRKKVGAEIAESWRPYREMVEAMWAEGMTGREIAEALGYSSKRANPSDWRALGYDIPYRRAGRALENILAGSRERMLYAAAQRKQLT